MDSDDLASVADPELWLPEAIQQTRRSLERTPEHWTFDRVMLRAQLDSLLCEEKREHDRPPCEPDNWMTPTGPHGPKRRAG